MSLDLRDDEKAWMADGASPGRALAMRIVAESARLLGAPSLLPIASAHIDGCLYHGDGGVDFAEKLAEGETKIAVPATLNVGALDLTNPDTVRSDPHHRAMSKRLMDIYLQLGCLPTWTCAPYQAGNRPGVGENVAWGESNAVAFANSVLGARTNRYGDFLDICCAVSGRAPASGLHLSANRKAEIVLDVSELSEGVVDMDAFYPVLGALLGKVVGSNVAAVVGLPDATPEDRLKALGAAAASRGAVGLFHAVGITPEAATLAEACHGEEPREVISITPDMVRQARDSLSTTVGPQLDCVALGSPHFSLDETRQFAEISNGDRFSVPVYICTGRHVMEEIEQSGLRASLESQGVTFVVDTCVVVTPVLEDISGVLMTNSGKFAHYAGPNTGYAAVFGSLTDCVASAVAGKVQRDEAAWH